MAQVGTMYSVDPLYNLKEGVVISDVMYKVKPIITSASEEVDGEFQALSKRQDVLLERLDCLISSMRQSPTNENSIKELFHTDCPVDVVIRADPKKPPHWLSYVKKQLDCQNIQTWWKFHVHSSVTDFSKLSTFPLKVPLEVRHKFQLIVTVIWSNESCSPSLHVCPSIRTAIYGETNIVRFFGRILGVYDSFSSEREDVVTDMCLDLCEIIVSPSSSKQEKANAVKSLSLAVGSWFPDNVTTLSTAFLASCLANHGSKNVPQGNLQNWLKKQKPCLDF